VDFQFLEIEGEPLGPAPGRALDFFDLCRIGPPVPLLRRFPLAFCDRYRWLPLHETDQTAVAWLPRHVAAPVSAGAGTGPFLFVAMENPMDTAALAAIGMRSGRRVQAVLADGAALDRFFAERYPEPPPAKGRFMRR
jgi:hypothetical protein